MWKEAQLHFTSVNVDSDVIIWQLSQWPEAYIEQESYLSNHPWQL